MSNMMHQFVCVADRHDFVIGAVNDAEEAVDVPDAVDGRAEEEVHGVYDAPWHVVAVLGRYDAPHATGEWRD